MNSNGYVSLGKFTTARDEILYTLCNSGWAEEEFGNSVDWHLYAWKVEVTAADLLTSADLQEVIAEATEGMTSYDSTELVGVWLVIENSSGAVSSAAFTPEEWKTYEDAYNSYAADAIDSGDWE